MQQSELSSVSIDWFGKYIASFYHASQTEIEFIESESPSDKTEDHHLNKRQSKTSVPGNRSIYIQILVHFIDLIHEWP